MGVPRPYLLHSVHAKQEICLDTYCVPVDIKRAYLNVQPNVEHDPVLLWSMDNIDVSGPHTITMRMLESGEEVGNVTKGMTFSHLEYTRVTWPSLVLVAVLRHVAVVLRVITIDTPRVILRIPVAALSIAVHILRITTLFHVIILDVPPIVFRLVTTDIHMISLNFPVSPRYHSDRSCDIPAGHSLSGFPFGHHLFYARQTLNV
ncbi:hypothetical protein FRB94_011165 [Tulasnella sp. JGI-2019a]|nr:hypothetical protein FRB94_011165 [Tulasnella sp. JGI-2019a]